ncbi:MAG: hypothetical protein LBN95_04230 [Prevotellaceae bacterium]|jgi:hypothetical protein|nr:hypothetical protein [Prevotellaceae bacterium]
MKKFIPIIVFTTILFQSCNWDNPAYHTFQGYTIGTLKGSTSRVYSLQDDSTTVLLVGLVAKSDSAFGERYYAEGTMYEQGYGENGYDMTLEVINYCAVLVKNLIAAEKQDSIEKVSTDGFDFENNYNRSRIFRTGKYLNIPISIYADNVDKHTIDYYIDASTEKFEKSEVKIYLTHNANNDTKNNRAYYFMYSSLDLTQIFEHYESGKEITLTFIYKDLYNQQQTISLKVIS